MKRVHLFVVATVLGLAALIGCAGSDTGNTPNVTTGDLTGARIEAVVVVDRSNLKDPSKYTDAELRDPTKIDPNDLINPTLVGVQDPRNIQTGEQYYFQLVTYDAAGNRIIHDDVSWQTSDTNGRFGNIGSNSGLFLAGSNVNQTDQFIFGFADGVRYEAKYNIKPRQVRLIGKVLDEDTGMPVLNQNHVGVDIFFFDNFGTLVGQATSSYDGTFRASVPTNTVKFTPTVGSVPVTPIEYYQSFLYQGLRYTIGYAQCKAPLPALVPGTVVLTDPILLKQRVPGQPTPPPTGCTL
jgi:hypothetical protein